MLDFVIVKDFIEFVVSKFSWHPFHNKSLAFFFNLVGLGKTDL